MLGTGWFNQLIYNQVSCDWYWMKLWVLGKAYSHFRLKRQSKDPLLHLVYCQSRNATEGKLQYLARTRQKNAFHKGQALSHSLDAGCPAQQGRWKGWTGARLLNRVASWPPSQIRMLPLQYKSSTGHCIPNVKLPFTKTFLHLSVHFRCF